MANPSQVFRVDIVCPLYYNYHVVQAVTCDRLYNIQCWIIFSPCPSFYFNVVTHTYLILLYADLNPPDRIDH